MKHMFEITLTELLWYLVALIFVIALLTKLGGLDDAAARQLPEGTPHGVVGTLKGEQP
jgi:hypothetical protein